MSTTIRLSKDKITALAEGKHVLAQTDRSQMVHVAPELDYRVIRDGVAFSNTQAPGLHIYAVIEGRLYEDGWLGFVQSRHLLGYTGDAPGAGGSQVTRTSLGVDTARPSRGLWVGPGKSFTLVER